MTEKESNAIMSELWTLIAMDAEATKHQFEISSRQIKCITREDGSDMTPYKRKVIEELNLLWRFVKVIHEDLLKISSRLNSRETVPACPNLIICDELWDVKNGGLNNSVLDIIEKIGDFQFKMQDAIWELQELCQ